MTALVGNLVRHLSILLLATGALAQQDDVLLTATHDQLNQTVRQALAADAETLKKWSKRVGKDKDVKKEFCPDYEREYLASFYSALADSKTYTEEKAREATAQATWMVYLLASLRPTTKEELKQVLLQAKEGAPVSISAEDEKRHFTARDKIKKNLVMLEAPTPRRIRISQATAECFLASKVQPTYPPLAMSQRITGDAVLKIIVGKDGKVMQMAPVSGPPVLLRSSMAAVQHWQYRPYHLLGETDRV
jgi:hypothetical protein